MESDSIDQYLIGLCCLECLGPITLKNLLEKTDSPDAIWRASFSNLCALGTPKKIAEKIIIEKKNLNLNETLTCLKKEKIEVISYYKEGYPLSLKDVYAPPILLFCKGNLELLHNKTMLAVVGSRKISLYCKKIMPEILKPALRQKTTIISGLALGVDAFAHQLALEENAPTIGVLGSGVSWEAFYPKYNLLLAKKMLEKGNLIISEFAPLSKAATYNFPKRNRIIAGLSRAVLIAEAAQKSGALITAKNALTTNKDILAIPQNIDGRNAAGVNTLIQNGAYPICSANDLLFALGLKLQNEQETNIELFNQLEPILKKIYLLLDAEATHIDKIIEKSKLTPAQINCSLMQLELLGLIKNLGNQNYIKYFQ